MITRPHGETNITLACQNRCVACNHFVPVQDPWFIEPEDLKRDLAMASKIVHFERYNLVGGEPMLHPKLMELLHILKDSGIADTLEITSNGQAIERMPDEFFTVLDELIITPYKLSAELIDYIKRKCAEAGLALQWHPVIFTEVAYGNKANEPDAYNRYKRCWYNVNRHVIDGGYFYRCCTAPFIPSVLLGMAKERDGIKLEGLTEAGLTAYLDQQETPESCYVCASNCGRQLPWRETTKDRWLAESITNWAGSSKSVNPYIAGKLRDITNGYANS